MNRRNLLLTSVFALIAWGLCAQPYYKQRTFSTNDGMGADGISSVAQSPDGMMWFATMNGLCNFDGYHFTTFNDDKDTNEVLTTNRLLKIKSNADGNIWCISRDSRLYIFDTRTCQFTDVGERLAQKYGQTFSFRGIFSLANGFTWVTCDDASHSVFRIKDAAIADDSSIIKIDMKALGIKDAIVSDILLGSDGSEWIVSDKATVLYGRTFKNKTAYSLVQPIDQQLYFASRQGQLACYQHGAHGLTPINVPDIGRVNCLARQGSTLIIGTNAGLKAYHTASGQSVAIGAGKDDIKTVMVDSKKRIWAIDSQNDILMYDTSLQEHRMQLPSPQPTTNFSEKIFLQESHGNVWVLPSNRLVCHYDEKFQRLTVSNSTPPSPKNLPNIRRVFSDSQQNIWYITENNKLVQLSFGYRDIQYHEVAAGHNTRAIYFDDGDHLWVGDDDGIVTLYDRDLNRIGYLSASGKVQPTATTFSSRIFAFFKDSRSRFWIGTKGQGLYMLDAAGVHHYVNNPADSHSLSSNDIYCIDEDERHHLWVGTFDGGLNLVSTSGTGDITFINPHSGLTNYPAENGRIRRITHDGRGTVLLSTTNGLITFSNRFTRPADIQFYVSRHVKGQTSSLLSNDVAQTLVNKNGDIFVVSIGGGIQKIVSEKLLKDQLTFKPLNQLRTHEGIVLSLAEDADGKIWLGREESVNSYTPSTNTLMRYGIGMIDANIGISEAQPAISPDRRYIALGVMNGFLYFDSKQLNTSSEAPRIVFTSVQFQGETDSHPILRLDKLNVPYDKRNLTISFAALDFEGSENIRYAYRLEGIDKEWNYLQNGHSASFNNLPAGDLKLLVKSTDKYGVWTENTAVLNIYSHPSFWETPWAWVLYLAILMALIVLVIYIYRIRTLASMEHKLNNMKTRFFTEIGHKLRTPLTLIGGPVTEVLGSDNLTDDEREHLEKVQRNSRNMLELVNKMLDRSQDDNYFVDDPDAPVFAGHSAFISATADTEQHPNIKLMVVEDNDDLRSFLVSILQGDYTVIEAENGHVGLEKAQTELPDFIITDVMMPEMDGLTMVQRIKRNADICHIPIIVLSAKASLEDRLQGLKAGIDDYITKPFSATYLKQRVENIIGQRRMLQQTLLTQLGESIGADRTRNVERFRLDEVQILDADQEMMESLMKHIETRIDDQDLKIEELADAVNLGRTVFYGKIKSIVGMSPSDFLRHVRLQRAEELISKSQMTFSQIAYSVGFSDPKYFTKCFKKETGMTPSEYRQKAKES